MDPETIVGMPVVAVAEAGKLGYVTDLTFDTDPFAVRALRLRNDDGEVLVPYQAVVSVGRDAVTVQNESVATAAPSATRDDVLTRASLHALKIVDESGTFLGTVKSVEIDRESGRVRRVTTERGGVMGMGAEVRTFDAEAIRHVGKEIVTVTEGAAMPPGGS